jgi:hypothetical protein
MFLRLFASVLIRLLLLILLRDLFLLTDHILLGLTVRYSHISHFLRYYCFLEIFLKLLCMLLLLVIVERLMHAPNHLLLTLWMLLLTREELFLRDVVRLNGNTILRIISASLLRANNSTVTRLVYTVCPHSSFLTTIYEEFTLCARSPNNNFAALSSRLRYNLFNDGSKRRTHRLLNIVFLHLSRIIIGSARYQLEYIVAFI